MKIKAIFKVFRTNEWWGNKVPAVLAIGYATSLKNDVRLIESLPSILLVFISIIVGAIYVSAINDLTDIDEDLKSGKSNRMAKIPSRYRWLLPIISAVIGVLFFYLYLPDKLSACLYLLPWISFSLYSFRPFRLKQRGIWGLIADASGAHLFISLLMVSHITYISKEPFDGLWFSLIGLWSLFFGLRGILWHQFYDREDDLKVKSTTFATGTTPEHFKKYEKLFFLIELAALTFVLWDLSIAIINLAAVCYCLLTYLRHRVLGHCHVIVIAPVKLPSQILLLDFYQVFFPLALLVSICVYQPEAWAIFVFHVLFFPGRLITIGKDMIVILRTVIKKPLRPNIRRF